LRYEETTVFIEMFGLFGNSKSECPIDENQRKWVESSLLWLFDTFGEQHLKSKRILTPSFEDFPFKYTGEHSTLTATSNIIAGQMDISPDDISFDVYTEGQVEIDTGSGLGRIFMKNDENEKYSSGKYWGKQEDGKYHIGIKEDNLKDPASLIATISHEFSHIKLLGENKLKKNNEPLTDIATVVFGMGVFNANAAFQFKRDVGSWGYSKLGYLTQMEWAYALAVFAHIRGEQSPKWMEFLDRTVKADFKQSERFINANVDKILQR
jgi:hypothetical protein